MMANKSGESGIIKTIRHIDFDGLIYQSNIERDLYFTYVNIRDTFQFISTKCSAVNDLEKYRLNELKEPGFCTRTIVIFRFGVSL